MTASSLISDLIIGPVEARELSHRFVNQLVEDKKAGIGIPSRLKNLDDILNPLKPGQMRVIMGRPGGGKSALMMHFSRVAAEMWQAQTTKKTCPPIFVSAEMALEEIMLREISHYIPVDSILLERGTYDDWRKVHEAIDMIAEERQMIFIGHSLEQGKRRPRLSIENVWKAVDHITEEWGMSPCLISIDYAQRLKLDKITRDRRIEISEIVETVKDMSLAFATPINLGSQVGRQVDERMPPVPEMSDAKETANLEETADSVLGVMRPIKYFKVGQKIPGSDLECVEQLFFINVLKQRQGASGEGRWVWFDMSISRIADLEFQRVELND
jgi:replicative DNA helicase